MDIKRVIKSKDTEVYLQTYEIIKEWWAFWKFPAPPIEFLPENMICAHNGEELVAVGFLFATDSKISWLEFIVSNNKSSKENRAAGLEYLISAAKVLASALGFGAVFTTSKNQSLNNKLIKKYIKTDEGVTHFIGRI